MEKVKFTEIFVVLFLIFLFVLGIRKINNYRPTVQDKIPAYSYCVNVWNNRNDSWDLLGCVTYEQNQPPKSYNRCGIESCVKVINYTAKYFLVYAFEGNEIVCFVPQKRFETVNKGDKLNSPFNCKRK